MQTYFTITHCKQWTSWLSSQFTDKKLSYCRQTPWQHGNIHDNKI